MQQQDPNSKPFVEPTTASFQHVETVYNPNFHQPIVNYSQQYPNQQPNVNYSPQIIPNVQQQIYQPPVMIQQQQQPLPTMPPVAANNVMNGKQKLTTTTFQNLISQKSSTLHELILQNQDSMLTCFVQLLVVSEFAV